MMQATYTWHRNQLGPCRRLALYQSVPGRLFLKSIVCTIVMVVVDVFPDQTPQMPFVQNNHVVQQFPATTADPSLRQTILPGAAVACASRFCPARLQHLDYVFAELRIPIQDHVPVTAGVWKRLAQLLHNPLARGVLRGIEMKDPPPVVFDHEKAVQHAKGHGRDGEEVQRGDSFPMIPQKDEPPLSGICLANSTSQVPRDGAFGNLKPEFEQLTVNSGSTPAWVLRSHPQDELANLCINSRSADSACLGSKTPIQSKPRPMPANDGLGFYQNQCLSPSGPQTAECDPEQSVPPFQAGSRALTLENNDLLPVLVESTTKLGRPAQQWNSGSSFPKKWKS